MAAPAALMGLHFVGTPRVRLRQKNTLFKKIEDLREVGASMSIAG